MYMTRERYQATRYVFYKKLVLIFFICLIYIYKIAMSNSVFKRIKRKTNFQSFFVTLFLSSVIDK